MGVIHSSWTFDAWCVSTLASGDAVPHIPTGWLEMLRRGFLHRDVSIGNTLMLDPPVMMGPFRAREVKQLMTQLPLRYEGDLARYARLLEDEIEGVDHMDKCCGFIIDGDMAASLDDYFTPRDMGEVSVSVCLDVCENPTNGHYAGDI